MKQLVIICAGGIGREVAWLVERLYLADHFPYRFVGFVDDQVRDTVEGYPILGNIKWLESQTNKPDIVCALGDPIKRYTVCKNLEAAGFKFATLIDPSVQMSKHVYVGEGSLIFANCVLTTNVTIGANVIISPSCTIGHDTTIGEYVSIMPGVNIAGNVNIGKYVFIGIGVRVINNLKIGDESLIGGGATVTKDIPNKVVAVGTPAKPVR
ncbi:MAG TPA: transferase [Desulfotomaculum sp.]|nr:MAG: hypothetical protein VR67_10845 [Peptococcaceae bacterium BRH_c8a]KJS71818.1 MAG: hypothetical protein JL56_14105 [Desulfotomaculum sp. BICA1-6]HBX23860.1 transferase [Desulfotomaculum sp.]